jgi:hypothetical protein
MITLAQNPTASGMQYQPARGKLSLEEKASECLLVMDAFLTQIVDPLMPFFIYMLAVFSLLIVVF